MIFCCLLINLSMFSMQAVSCVDGVISIRECIDQNYDIRFLFSEDSSEQFVACFPLGAVANEGGIVTNNGKVLLDTETHKDDQHHLLRNGLPKEQLFFDGTLVVISSAGQENWYHWLLQVLPRLKILADSQYSFDKIYINNLNYDWQKKSLKIVCDALCIPADKFLCVEGDILVQAKMLLVPSVPFIPSKNRRVVPNWFKEFIHESFLPETNCLKTSDKIYISRSKAQSRRIINEDQFIAMLKKHGFVALHLEDLSACDQAAAFHNAQIIVGPHGSGFANLIFSKPGTRVIEIDHAIEGEARSCFKGFTKKMSCDYIPFYADFVEEEDLDKDMEIDLIAFEELMIKVLK